MILTTLIVPLPLPLKRNTQICMVPFSVCRVNIPIHLCPTFIELKSPTTLFSASLTPHHTWQHALIFSNLAMRKLFLAKPYLSGTEPKLDSHFLNKPSSQTSCLTGLSNLADNRNPAYKYYVN